MYKLYILHNTGTFSRKNLNFTIDPLSMGIQNILFEVYLTQNKVDSFLIEKNLE